MENKKIGKAYAFFDSDASYEELERDMPEIRDYAQTSEGLQLLLHRGSSRLQVSDRPDTLTKEPKDYRVLSSRLSGGVARERKSLERMDYVLEASCEGMSNERVAGELGDVLNTIYRMYDEDSGQFNGAVVYEDNGEFVFRR
ncbi:hypothetical protein HOD75_02160 [archaeon]|jgi:hypothetical protein|nr:hypothetical protein [archaeon]MBT4241681.1 hypothetical protein [archaeon]MBT4418076.1 hypothetical protein [archaeon]